MIPTQPEMFRLIEDEGCELVGEGRWELSEILDFFYEYYKMTDAEFNKCFRTIINTWAALCKEQRWENECRKNGWTIGWAKGA